MFGRRRRSELVEPVKLPTNGQQAVPRKLLEHAFTSENAAAAAYRSAEVRRQKRDDKRERSEQVARIVDTLDRAHLGPFTLMAALKLAEAAVSGDITVPQNARERKTLAETAEILHRIGRLETDQSTANVAHATMDDASRAARLVEIEQRVALLRGVSEIDTLRLVASPELDATDTPEYLDAQPSMSRDMLLHRSRDTERDT